MSDDQSSSPISVPPSAQRRRSSFSFTDFLSRPAVPPSSQTGPSPSLPTTMAGGVVNPEQNQRRRLSITTLGLSGSPNQNSPFASRAFRRASLSSSVGSTGFEEAVSEDTESTPLSATPSSPFVRRVSFGAQALRDVRGGSLGNGRSSPASPSATAGGRRTVSSAGLSTILNAASPNNKYIPQSEQSNPSLRFLGEGFNWSEALRARAERAPSIVRANSPPSPGAQQPYTAGLHGHHQRAASIAVMEQPVREQPRQPKQNKPDFFQEKILRGDFMD